MRKKQYSESGKVIKFYPYDDEGEDKLLWLSDRQRQILLVLSEYMGWSNRWGSMPPDIVDKLAIKDYTDTTRDRLMVVVEFCAEMIKCIDNDADTIDALNRYITYQMYNNTDIQIATNYAAHTLPGQETPNPGMDKNMLNPAVACDPHALSGAIVYLVEFMNDNNEDFVQRLVSAATPYSRSKVMNDMIPEFSGDVVGGSLSAALSFLSGALQTNYEAYYTETYEDDLICELRCLAEPNCTLTLEQLYHVFSDRVGYTIDIGDTFKNAISFALFGEFTSEKYVDLMHFIQIGAFVFMGGFVGYRSLNPLVNALTAGADEPVDDYDDCDCAELVAENVGLFTYCGSGVIDSIPFEPGVPFDVDSYEIIVGEDHAHLIALKLPPGLWNVTLNSFTGDIPEPSDPNETAYAWYDTDGVFHNVLYNAPSDASDFGTHDTSRGVFSAWCSVQNWNVVLGNEAEFTANFTVTGIT